MGTALLPSFFCFSIFIYHVLILQCFLVISETCCINHTPVLANLYWFMRKKDLGLFCVLFFSREEGIFFGISLHG